MQGLADGYFIIPYTIGDYLAHEIRTGPISTQSPEFDKAEEEVNAQLDIIMTLNGSKPVDHFHMRLGKIMWNNCGMARNAGGLSNGIQEIQALREEFWKDLRVPGKLNEFNQELEKAGRVADFLELGELMLLWQQTNLPKPESHIS